MSDYIKLLSDEISKEAPTGAEPEKKPDPEPEEGLTLEKVNSLITKALESRNDDVKKIAEDIVANSLKNLSEYKPEKVTPEPEKKEEN